MTISTLLLGGAVTANLICALACWVATRTKVPAPKKRWPSQNDIVTIRLVTFEAARDLVDAGAIEGRSTEIEAMAEAELTLGTARLRSARDA